MAKMYSRTPGEPSPKEKLLAEKIKNMPRPPNYKLYFWLAISLDIILLTTLIIKIVR